MGILFSNLDIKYIGQGINDLGSTITLTSAIVSHHHVKIDIQVDKHEIIAYNLIGLL